MLDVLTQEEPLTLGVITDWYAHPTAAVDEGAQIGRGTRIWHFSHVMSEAVIGRNCTLGQNVHVASRARVGDHCKIQNNVSIYEGVILEDHVFCGPSMVFTNVATPRSAYPRNRSQDYLATLVKCGATIGANATIVCGNTIGEHAFIGAGSVVTRDVPDYALVYGNPARIRGWACECGIRLLFEGSRGHCPECGKRYVVLSSGHIRLERAA